MTTYGYTLMTEQSGPVDLVRYAQAAERAGFDFEVMSDHFSPWLDSQGHAPNAWATLGAVAQATEQVELMTYVTCPIMRYHPVVVAQQAATIGLLSNGRFLLGLGAGENLNEHVVGRGWPAANVRHEMFDEAVHIIRELFEGNYVNFAGKHFRVDSAKLWDVADQPPAIGLAISGEQSATLAGELADAMIAVEPDADLVRSSIKHGGQGKRRIGQVPICWDPSEDAASSGRTTSSAGSAAAGRSTPNCPARPRSPGASQFVRPEDVADSIPCGPDVAAHVDAVREFEKAGFTDIAVIQIGDREPARIPRVGRSRNSCPRCAAEVADVAQDRTGVVFDVDGTLVDTTFIHTVCWADALAMGGHQVPMATIHHAIGMGSSELLDYLLPDRDTDGDEQIVTARLALYRQYWGRLPAFRGAADLLRACANRGPPGRAGLVRIIRRAGCPEAGVWTPTTSSTLRPARPTPTAASPRRTSSPRRSSSPGWPQSRPCSSVIRCGTPRRRRRRRSRSWGSPAAGLLPMSCARRVRSRPGVIPRSYSTSSATA